MAGNYFFDRSELRTETRELLIDGKPVALGGRAFDVLLVLIERCDQFVSKDDLMSLAWPGVVVEEANLHVQISALRKVLGPQAITTVYGRGYRFTAPLIRGPIRDPKKVEAGDLSSGTRQVSAAALTNAPAAAGPLIGRDQDLAALTELLSQHRIVSIVGTGGIGKTRVAQALAHAIKDNFRDGARWVELAPASNRLHMIASITSAIGTLGVGDIEAQAGLISALAPMHVLVVLDNCEHLLADVADLVHSALASCPRVFWLTTSIEPLKLSDECIYRLDTLAVPPTDSSLSDAMAFGAFALFARRAETVDRRFSAVDVNTDVIIDICRQLDGVALALEMAAARVPHLGLAGVRDRLSERLRLLIGARGVPSRQQTLRATVDWSYGLLASDEQQVLRSLAVFVNGFTLDSLQRTVSGSGMASWDVLQALSGLVDKSLVQLAVEAAHTPPRYSLLETTRLYAMEKLAETAQVEILARSHCRAMAHWAIQVQQLEEAVSFKELLLRCQMEWGNLLAALECARRFNMDAEFVPLFIAGSLLAVQGAERSSIEHLAEHAYRLASTESPIVASGLYRAIGSLFTVAANQRAEDAYRRALDCSRKAGDQWQLYRSLATLTRLLGSGSQLGTPAELERLIDEALSIEQPDWPPRQRVLETRASLRYARAGAYADRGEFNLARIQFNEAKVFYEEASSVRGALTTLIALMDLEIRAGNRAAAVRIGESLLPQLRSAGVVRTFFPLSMLCGLYAKADLDRARSLAAETLVAVRRQRVALAPFTSVALFVASEGRVEDAARFIGYVDASVRAAHHRYERTADNFRTEALDLVDKALGPKLRAQLLDEGASLTDAEADSIVLGSLEK